MGTIRNRYGTSPLGGGGGGGGGGGNNNNNNNNNNRNNNNNNNNNNGGYSGYTPNYGFVKPPTVSTQPLTITPLGGNNKGGGGGGGGAQPPPALNDPDYAGDAGRNRADTDPQSQQDYIKWALTMAGIIGNTDTPYSRWAEDTLLGDIYNDFLKAQGTNKSMSVIDFMLNTYGAGYTGTEQVMGGKHGQKVKTPSNWVYGQGDFGQTTGGLPERYQDFLSEDDPAGFLAGIVGGGNSDPEWNDFFRSFTMQIESELAAARRSSGNPDLTLNQFVKNRDLAGEANSAFGGYLSNQHPEETIRGLIAGSGDMTDPDYIAFWNNVIMPDIAAGFQAARQGNPKLTLNEYLASNAGAVSAAAGRFAEYKANQHPEDYLGGAAVNQGVVKTVGGNQDFQTWYKQQAIPNQMNQLWAARQGQPTLGVKSFFDPQDLGTQARMNYLYRPTATRLPSQTVQAGRYSWWG